MQDVVHKKKKCRFSPVCCWCCCICCCESDPLFLEARIPATGYRPREIISLQLIATNTSSEDISEFKIELIRVWTNVWAFDGFFFKLAQFNCWFFFSTSRGVSMPMGARQKMIARYCGRRGPMVVHAMKSKIIASRSLCRIHRPAMMQPAKYLASFISCGWVMPDLVWNRKSLRAKSYIKFSDSDLIQSTFTLNEPNLARQNHRHCLELPCLLIKHASRVYLIKGGFRDIVIRSVVKQKRIALLTRNVQLTKFQSVADIISPIYCSAPSPYKILRNNLIISQILN